MLHSAFRGGGTGWCQNSLLGVQDSHVAEMSALLFVKTQIKAPYEGLDVSLSFAVSL